MGNTGLIYGVKNYESLKEAQERTGITYTGISAVIHGKGKTAGGFKWSLKTDKYKN